MGEKSGTVNAAIDTLYVEQIVKNAPNEQKKAELDKENRYLNFIIHRIPESDKPDSQRRKKDDLQVIEKLFGELEVDYEPKQYLRLGRFDKEADPDNRKPRPLKVIMNSQEEQAQVMMHLSKLWDAPGFLRKKMSISPDLSREERDELNEKLREAKQLTSEPPNLIFKVKGMPGNYHFIKILKSRNDQKTSPSSKPAPKKTGGTQQNYSQDKCLNSKNRNDRNRNEKCINHDVLKAYYTNIDTLIVIKKAEIETDITKPDIICLHEVLPKHYQ